MRHLLTITYRQMDAQITEVPGKILKDSIFESGNALTDCSYAEVFRGFLTNRCVSSYFLGVFYQKNIEEKKASREFYGKKGNETDRHLEHRSWMKGEVDII